MTASSRLRALAEGLHDPQLPRDPELPPLLDKVLPVHEVVPVDLTLPGCPPPADAFRALVLAELARRTLEQAECLICRLNELDSHPSEPEIPD